MSGSSLRTLMTLQHIAHAPCSIGLKYVNRSLAKTVEHEEGAKLHWKLTPHDVRTRGAPCARGARGSSRSTRERADLPSFARAPAQPIGLLIVESCACCKGRGERCSRKQHAREWWSHPSHESRGFWTPILPRLLHDAAWKRCAALMMRHNPPTRV